MQDLILQANFFFSNKILLRIIILFYDTVFNQLCSSRINFFFYVQKKIWFDVII